MKTINLIIIKFILFSCISLNSGSPDDSITLFCADPKCSQPISSGKTKINYPNPDSKYKLSFRGNVAVQVHGKPRLNSGKASELWLVSLQGRRGLVSAQNIREDKILIKTEELTFEVPFPFRDGTESKQNNDPEEKLIKEEISSDNNQPIVPGDGQFPENSFGSNDTEPVPGPTIEQTPFPEHRNTTVNLEDPGNQSTHSESNEKPDLTTVGPVPGYSEETAGLENPTITAIDTQSIGGLDKPEGTLVTPNITSETTDPPADQLNSTSGPVGSTTDQQNLSNLSDFKSESVSNEGNLLSPPSDPVVSGGGIPLTVGITDTQATGIPDKMDERLETPSSTSEIQHPPLEQINSTSGPMDSTSDQQDLSNPSDLKPEIVSIVGKPPSPPSDPVVYPSGGEIPLPVETRATGILDAQLNSSESGVEIPPTAPTDNENSTFGTVASSPEQQILSNLSDFKSETVSAEGKRPPSPSDPIVLPAGEEIPLTVQITDTQATGIVDKPDETVEIQINSTTESDFATNSSESNDEKPLRDNPSSEPSGPTPVQEDLTNLNHFPPETGRTEQNDNETIDSNEIINSIPPDSIPDQRDPSILSDLKPEIVTVVEKPSPSPSYPEIPSKSNVENPTNPFEPAINIPNEVVSDSDQISIDNDRLGVTEPPFIKKYVYTVGDEQSDNLFNNPLDVTVETTTPTVPLVDDYYDPPPVQSEERIESLSDGLFTQLWKSVKNVFDDKHEPIGMDQQDGHDHFDMDRLLFGDQGKESKLADDVEGYCEQLTPNSCPKTHQTKHSTSRRLSMESIRNGINYDDYLQILAEQLLEMGDLIVYLVVTAITILGFTLGHYCITSNRKESALLSKLNIVERQLMTSSKECDVLKGDLLDTRGKLTSIEDNSFGSNEMVCSLKKQLEASDLERLDLKEQIFTLEKELENAAEAGLELNKMVSELLNNQSGSDTIISTVEELQRQLNEQEATSLSINALLAEKSRENSELQVELTKKQQQYEEDLDEIRNQYKTLSKERDELELELIDSKALITTKIEKELQEKNVEILKLSKDCADLKSTIDQMRLQLHTSESRVQVLEECVQKIKSKTDFDVGELMNVANVKTKLLAINKERDYLKDQLDGERDARKLLEDHVKVVSDEVANLRLEYNQAEKDKLEALTRLEVLSTYFKEKELQLQKELSVKEAMSMKQQGETTSVVERINALQEEIQRLKSQNDSLKIEIEAQAVGHKAQINAAENRAHESWLAARQVERRFEESRMEASALRRRLTSMAGTNGTITDNNIHNQHNPDGGLQNAPSPIHMDAPSSPLMGVLPPLAFPPPFMPPHPFMPPPPFLPPGEMRPPPLGRLMSPPPSQNNHRYSPPNRIDERDRYSPDRGRYSPADNDRYGRHSPYDTETDFSPPPSPPLPRSGYRDRGGYRSYSPSPPPQQQQPTKSHPSKPDSRLNKSNSSKGALSSGSIDSIGSRKNRNDGKV